MTDKLRNRIEKLSDEDRRLLALKAKEAIIAKSQKLNDYSSKKIVVYIETDESIENDDLKSFLKQKLPDYMIPSLIKRIEHAPLLPNGKIDKKKLRNIKAIECNSTEAISSINSPENDIEAQLVEIWEDVLGFSPISTTDNFFEIGGDSILSIQIISQTKKNGIDINPKDLFESQTIKELAKSLSKKPTISAKTTHFNHITEVKASGNLPPLFCIHGGGRHFFYYNTLRNHVNTERPVFAVQASDIEKDIIMHQSIEQMAEKFLEEIKMIAPKGPYHIMAYCFSTAVGLEISQILKRNGEEVNLIIVDTIAIHQSRYAPSKTKRRVIGFLQRFTKNPIRAGYLFLRSRAGKYLKPFILKHIGNDIEKNIELLRNNHAKNYLNYHWKTYNNNISVILTEKEDTTLNPEIIESWNEISNNKTKLLYTIGHHNHLFEEPTVKNTAIKLEECMTNFEKKMKYNLNHAREAS